MQNPQPLGARVLVLQYKAPEKIGSVLLAVSAQEAPLEGDVVAVGPDCKALKVGDVCAFTSYAGIPIPGERADGRVLLVIHEDEILVYEPAAS